MIALGIVSVCAMMVVSVMTIISHIVAIKKCTSPKK